MNLRTMVLVAGLKGPLAPGKSTKRKARQPFFLNTPLAIVPIGVKSCTGKRMLIVTPTMRDCPAVLTSITYHDTVTGQYHTLPLNVVVSDTHPIEVVIPDEQ
jgi:hypothetical protein